MFEKQTRCLGLLHVVLYRSCHVKLIIVVQFELALI